MEVIDSTSLLQVIERLQHKKNLYIVGAGRYGKVLGKYFNANDIAWSGYIDKCPQYAETSLKKIITYEEIQDINGIYIISSIALKEEMKKCLAGKGISKNNIITLSGSEIIWEMFPQSICDYSFFLERLNKFRDIHWGERCFIVGNGPSLQVEDLDKLKGEFTFAMNSIYHLYQYTAWRPTYYITVSSTLIKHELGGIQEFIDMIEECDAVFTTMLTCLFDYREDKEMDKVYYLKTLNYEETAELGNRFSEDCSKQVYCSSTVLYVALQLAVYMGFKKIYLVGVDCSFSVESNEDGGITINNTMDYNKLIQQNRDNSNFTEILSEKYGNVHNSYETVKEYKTARDYADAHKIHIYNATRGGKLDVFERMDFDKIVFEDL